MEKFLKTLTLKKVLRILFILVTLAIIFAPVVTALSNVAHISPLLAAAFLATCFFLLPKTGIKGVVSSGIQKEIWEADIVGNLFKDNEFMRYSYDASQYVLEGKVVHIPNAGIVPAVQKNRAVLPGTVTQRTDVDVTYPLDEYTTDPILIKYSEALELSYDKRQSVTGESQAQLRQQVAENMIVEWAPPSTSVVLTSGGAVAAQVPGATGNRAIFQLADLQTAMTKMNNQNIPMPERYALMSANMYDQFINGMNATTYRDFSRAFNEKEGILGRLYGFNIMMRSSVMTYDATNTVKPVGAAGATTDDDAVLCWQRNSLEHALGTVQMFEQMQAPTYYGDIFSFLVMMGGRIRRNDGLGVLAIVQAPHA